MGWNPAVSSLRPTMAGVSGAAPMNRFGRREVLRGVAIGGAIALAGCTGSSTPETVTDTQAPGPTGQSVTEGSEESVPSTQANADSEAWRSITLTDVDSGETFTVDEFAGQPVLLESFAVWCPVCTTQQKHIATLHEQRSDVVTISLNTDPNENAERVKAHKDSHGFDWRYAVSPPAMTESLLDTFGIIITNAPAAPVVRICPDGTASLVSGGGAKSAEKLAAAIDAC